MWAEQQAVPAQMPASGLPGSRCRHPAQVSLQDVTAPVSCDCNILQGGRSTHRAVRENGTQVFTSLSSRVGCDLSVHPRDEWLPRKSG